jgi:AcrR family transcriptional regulator
VRARKQSGQARRDQIAHAVLGIATERGLEAVSVAAVAARVGVSPPALYRHYPSKDAMLDATLERMAAGILANLEQVRAAGDDPLTSVTRLFERHVAFVRENRGIPLLIFSHDILHHRGRRRRLLSVMTTYRRGIKDLFRAAQRDGLVHPELDPATLSLMFFGLFQAPAILWHLHGGRFDFTGHARRGWAVFHHAIRTTPVRTRAPRTRARRVTQERPQ